MKNIDNKKKIRFLIIGIILIIAVISGVTYSYWKLTKKQTDFSKFTTMCLDLELKSSDSTKTNITLLDQWPMKNDDAINNYDGYDFYVKNKCSQSINIYIGLDQLTSLATSINPDAIKIGLYNDKYDETDIQKYGQYENVDTYSSSAVQAKKLKPITIDGNETINFNIKIWLDANADINENQNKEFDSKLFIAGAANANIQKPIYVLDDGSINKTGSEVAIGDEHFYVVSEDPNNSNNVLLLSKYNLLVGNASEYVPDINSEEGCNAKNYYWDEVVGICLNKYTIPTNTAGYNLQSKKARGYIWNEYQYEEEIDEETVTTKWKIDSATYENYEKTNAYDNIVSPDGSYYEAIGTVSYDDRTNPYWLYDNGGIKLEYERKKIENNFPTYEIYDENASIKKYVDKYKILLESKYGININEARLMSISDIFSIECEDTESGYVLCPNNSMFVLKNSYWLSTVRYSWSADVDTFSLPIMYSYDNYLNNDSYGVRPLISVSKSLFEPRKATIVTESGSVNKIGTEVALDTEHFYVIGNDSSNSNNVLLLAKNNISYEYKDSSNTIEIKNHYYGLQETKDSAFYLDFGYGWSNYPTYFAETSYWGGSTPNSTYGSTYPVYVYDDNSDLSDKLKIYKKKLEDVGFNISSIKLMDLDTAISLGCTKNGTCPTTKPWLYSVNYWLGNAQSATEIWSISEENLLTTTSIEDENNVRPIISVSKKLFE